MKKKNDIFFSSRDSDFSFVISRYQLGIETERRKKTRKSNIFYLIIVIKNPKRNNFLTFQKKSNTVKSRVLTRVTN